MLRVEDLRVAYGRTEVLHGVTFDAQASEIVAVIGPNGAGKSTLLMAIAGLLPTRAGAISVDGKPMDGLSPGQRVRQGVVLTPEGRQVFAGLSVRDNLLLGSFSRQSRSEVAADLESMLDLFPRLQERLSQFAGTLSGGEQQMLAIARALMTRPRVLLLDEPSLGLAPLVTRTILDTLARLRSDDLTIVLVEQNARAALKLADRAFLLETGEVRASGASSAMLQDAAVLATYLGGSSGKAPVPPPDTRVN